jgi:hypothetical protein
MDEDIIPALETNKPKSLPIVEPLNRTFCLHKNAPFLTATHSYVAGSGTQLAACPMKRNRQEEAKVEMTGSLERQDQSRNPSQLRLGQHVPRHFKCCQAIL